MRCLFDNAKSAQTVQYFLWHTSWHIVWSEAVTAAHGHPKFQSSQECVANHFRISDKQKGKGMRSGWGAIGPTGLSSQSLGVDLLLWSLCHRGLYKYTFM